MSNEKAGEEIKGTMYLLAERMIDGDYRHYISNTDESIYNWCSAILIDQKPVSMVIPESDINLDQLTIDKMRKEQDKISAEAQLKVNNIEETIQRMLCLTHQKEE